MVTFAKRSSMNFRVFSAMVFLSATPALLYSLINAFKISTALSGTGSVKPKFNMVVCLDPGQINKFDNKSFAMSSTLQNLTKYFLLSFTSCLWSKLILNLPYGVKTVSSN